MRLLKVDWLEHGEEELSENSRLKNRCMREIEFKSFFELLHRLGLGTFPPACGTNKGSNKLFLKSVPTTDVALTAMTNVLLKNFGVSSKKFLGPELNAEVVDSLRSGGSEGSAGSDVSRGGEASRINEAQGDASRVGEASRGNEAPQGAASGGGEVSRGNEAQGAVSGGGEASQGTEAQDELVGEKRKHRE